MEIEHCICDSYDIKDISDNMLKLIEDKKLQNKLKLNGQQRLKIFNWSKAGREIYDVYLFCYWILL